MDLRFCLIVIISSFFVNFVVCDNGETVFDEDFCGGRCNEADIKLSKSTNVLTSKRRPTTASKCSCSLNCMKNRSCCKDYIKTCHNNVMPSCNGLCGQDQIAGKPCQCGPQCVNKNNCCPDYQDMCLIKNVTDKEIEDMSESILFWDRQSISEWLTVNFQEKTDSNCAHRNSTTTFIALNSTAKIPATFFRLIELYNDYVADVSYDENYTTDELSDQYNFLIPVIESKVMKGVMNFLILKGFIAEDTSQFVTTLRNIWFTLYKRSKTNAELASSGFEHVFLGELEANEVTGFHNWLRFVQEDEDADIVYNGYMEKLKINHKVTVATINFKWQGKCKPTSSMFIGSSPEFELALYTLCWFTRPNALCPIVLGGHRLSIKTFYISDYLGDRFVSTAYPVLTGAAYLTSVHNFSLLFLLTVLTMYWNY